MLATRVAMGPIVYMAIKDSGDLVLDKQERAALCQLASSLACQARAHAPLIQQAIRTKPSRIKADP